MNKDEVKVSLEIVKLQIMAAEVACAQGHAGLSETYLAKGMELLGVVWEEITQ